MDNEAILTEFGEALRKEVYHHWDWEGKTDFIIAVKSSLEQILNKQEGCKAKITNYPCGCDDCNPTPPEEAALFIQKGDIIVCAKCGWGIASNGSCVNVNCKNLGVVIYSSPPEKN